jgi:hypothetical protein
MKKRTLCCMLVLNLILHHTLNTSYNRAQYKCPVPVQLLEVLKVVAISGQTPITMASSCLNDVGQGIHGDCCTCHSNFFTKVPQHSRFPVIQDILQGPPKKSRGVKSGEHAGKSNGVPLCPIQCPCRFSSRKADTSQW